ncbi:MAG: CRISPR-associated endonuclease Cas1, partial [Planctomycetaceae bacterium]|nr:CRISPR-associated endonuclease Cas1 [Planctomycetaceae bacterium]
MKQLGNTLYITKQESYVSRDGTNIVISCEHKELLRLPIHTIASIVCFGNVLVTPFALGLCGESNVTVSFLTENGHFLARVSGKQSGNILLRRAQHRLSTNSDGISLAARSFVSAKIANCRTILLRFTRDHSPTDSSKMDAVIRSLENSLQELKRSQPIERIRGIEGDTAKNYFSVFDQLILSNKKDFYFNE